MDSFHRHACTAGQVELEDLMWDVRKMALSGACVRPRGKEGNVYIIVPPGFKPVDYSGLWVAKDELDESVIVRKPIHFSRTRIGWRSGSSDAR